LTYAKPTARVRSVVNIDNETTVFRYLNNGVVSIRTENDKIKYWVVSRQQKHQPNIIL